MHVVIFAGGVVQPGRAVDAALARADMVIAADRGAETALRFGHLPMYIVGDLDSLDKQMLREAHERGSQVVQAQLEKDETDTELAAMVALQHGATEITLLGALGGSRIDHALANVLLLVGFEATPMHIVDGETSCWLLRGPGKTVIDGQQGDTLSLLPLTADADGVQTTGLYYSLRGETLSFGRPRGVSNVLTSHQAEVSLARGLLLIVHTGRSNDP
jgi:thiamine pyrophosphokinase